VQRPCFVDPSSPDFVCRLDKSLYGLKKTPRAWHKRIVSYLLSLGFVEVSLTHVSIYILYRGGDTVYLLLYVNAIVDHSRSSDTLLSMTTR